MNDILQESYLVNAYGERWDIEEFQKRNWNSDDAGWEHTSIRRLAMETIIPYTCGVGVDIGSQRCPVTNTAIRIDHDSRFFNLQHFDSLNGFRNLDYITASHVIEDQDNPIQTLRDWTSQIRIGGNICLLIPTCERYPKPGQPGANPAHRIETYPETYLEWAEQLKDVLKIVSHDQCKKYRERYKNMVDTDCVYTRIA